MKLGLVKEAFAAADPEVAKHVRAAVNSLQEQGAHIDEVSVPHFNKGISLMCPWEIWMQF